MVLELAVLEVCLQVGLQEDLVSNSEIQSAGPNSNLSFPASCGISNEVTADSVQKDRSGSSPLLPSAQPGSLLSRGGLKRNTSTKVGTATKKRRSSSEMVRLHFGADGSGAFPSSLPVPRRQPALAPGHRGSGWCAEGLTLLLMCKSVFSTQRSDPAALAAPCGTGTE